MKHIVDKVECSDVSVDEVDAYLDTSCCGFVVAVIKKISYPNQPRMYFILHVPTLGWHMFSLVTKSAWDSQSFLHFRNLFMAYADKFDFYAFSTFKEAIEFYVKEV
jgi:hypothetical protein